MRTREEVTRDILSAIWPANCQLHINPNIFPGHHWRKTQQSYYVLLKTKNRAYSTSCERFCPSILKDSISINVTDLQLEP